MNTYIFSLTPSFLDESNDGVNRLHAATCYCVAEYESEHVLFLLV